MRYSHALLCLLTTLLPQGVQAQLRGTVSDIEGQPLSAAEVEIWGEHGRLGAQATAQSGQFMFPTVALRDVNRLTVTRVGYRTETMVPRDSVLRIELEPSPLALSSIRVEIPQKHCPNVESPDARGLWEAARQRYSDQTSSRAMGVTMLQDRASQVTRENLGHADPASLRRVDAEWVGATRTRQRGRYYDINVQIAESGYARSTNLDQPPWRLVALDGRHAHHFASPVFGERHSLSIFQASSTETVLIFCPRSRSHPWIEGTLTIGADTSFSSVAWNFQTPAPVRVGGGEVFFGSWAEDGEARPHLMPLRSSSWIEHPRWPERYEHRYSVFTTWTVRATDAW